MAAKAVHCQKQYTRQKNCRHTKSDSGKRSGLQFKDWTKILLLVVSVAGLAAAGWWRCPFRLMTGLSCPGCGMTRALRALCSGDILTSFFWHPMCIPLLITAAAGSGLYFRKAWRSIRILMWTLAGMMIACWIYRLLFVFPGTPLEWTPHSVAGLLFAVYGKVQ